MPKIRAIGTRMIAIRIESMMDAPKRAQKPTYSGCVAFIGCSPVSAALTG